MQDIIDRKIQPPLQDIREVLVQQVEKKKLDNGIPLYTLNAGVQEVVKVELIFKNPKFRREQPLLFSSANRLLNEGTGKYNAQQLAEMMDYYGSFYESEQ